MSKQANKTVIGGFVVGAVALVVAGILIFGSGKLLAEKEIYVMYFKGSVGGLNVGSAVVFRGVKIGSVTNIALYADPADLSVRIPVFIGVKPDKFKIVGGRAQMHSPKKVLELLVERGLRAQLQMQSLVTGQLMVELDFHPDKPIKLVGADPEYMEIPTIQSDLEELVKRIEKAPIEEILNKLLSAVEGIESIVNSKEVKESLVTLDQTLNDIHKLVLNIDSRIEPLASGIDETMREFGKLARNIDGKVGPLVSSIDETVGDIGKLAQGIDGQIAPLASSIENTVKAFSAAAVQARKTIREIEATFGEDSLLIYELNDTLQGILAAANSIRVLADYLERHPESLIRGKGKPGGK